MSSRAAFLEMQAGRIEEALAEEIVKVATELVAVDTGKTQANIRKERRGSDWFIVSDRGGEHGDVAIYLEFGTRHMAPRPYLLPAKEIVLAAGGLNEVKRGVGGLLR
jgi:HK97 gp10 family phage protein